MQLVNCFAMLHVISNFLFLLFNSTHYKCRFDSVHLFTFVMSMIMICLRMRLPLETCSAVLKIVLSSAGFVLVF